jgi:hypothetical protein
MGAHILQTPDLSDPGTLSPTGTGAFGSSLLAQRVRAAGSTVTAAGSSAAAIRLASAEPNGAVIVVPTPDYLAASFWSDLEQIDIPVRVVIIAPGLRSLRNLSGRFQVGPDRWASTVAAPGDECRVPEAVTAGAAGILENRYGAAQTCYDGGLASVTQPNRSGVDVQYFAAGASDPFRNDRIDEAGNSALAVGLLDTGSPVIWADVHSSEPDPPVDVPPLTLPSYGRPDAHPSPTASGDNAGGAGAAASDPLTAFPPMLWLALAGLAIAAVLVGVARSRRLGPPVTEALPVLVPSAEVVAGRGRLLDRIGANDATLATLRGAAIRRLHRTLYPLAAPAAASTLLPDHDGAAPAGVDHFVAAVAARAAIPPSAVRDILYDPPRPDGADRAVGRQPRRKHKSIRDRDGLALAVADLDRLVHAVIGTAPSSGGES